MKKLSYILLAGMGLLFTACKEPIKSADLVNTRASLPANFNFKKLGLKVMSSGINKKQLTMTTLYANDLALKCAIAGEKEIKPGEVLALVTWKQQADEHWFGAKIPGDIKSVELIKTIKSTNNVPVINYQHFEGKDMILNQDTTQNQARIKYILAQQPSIMP